MMLAGEAVVAIWNGIAEDARDAFYAWHQTEHMPERVGIPGFLRGRRYVAAGPDTRPEFFTLYEAETLQVLQGAGYQDRLNAPTPWTRNVTARFLDTSRALARVVESRGPCMGGVVLTLRFDAAPGSEIALRRLVQATADGARITGAHLCVGDLVASAVRTTETKDRRDIREPPTWFAMIEATGIEALAEVLADAALMEAGAKGPIVRGCYRLETVRNKTSFAR
jgi:hypothetical protein